MYLANFQNLTFNEGSVAKNKWTSQSGAKSVFLNLSRDILKNLYMAPLRGVYYKTMLILPGKTFHALSKVQIVNSAIVSNNGVKKTIKLYILGY